MRWSIKKQADGVITDDPKRFLEVCDDWEHGKRKIHFTRKQWAEIMWFNFMIICFQCIYWWKFGSLPGAKVKRKPRHSDAVEKGAGPGVSMINNREDQ